MRRIGNIVRIASKWLLLLHLCSLASPGQAVSPEEKGLSIAIQMDERPNGQFVDGAA